MQSRYVILIKVADHSFGWSAQIRIQGTERLEISIKLQTAVSRILAGTGLCEMSLWWQCHRTAKKREAQKQQPEVGSSNTEILQKICNNILTKNKQESCLAI